MTSRERGTRGASRADARSRPVLRVDVGRAGSAERQHQALFEFVRHLDRSRYQPVLRLEWNKDGRKRFQAYLKESPGPASD